MGTVGITGTPAQVGRFGLLVKRQTEILIRESVMLAPAARRACGVEKLLTDIASYDPLVVEGDLLQFRAADLGFDLRLRRVAVAFEVTVPDPGARRGTRARDVALVRSELLRTVRDVSPTRRTSSPGRLRLDRPSCTGSRPGPRRTRRPPDRPPGRGRHRRPAQQPATERAPPRIG
ncbi:hypothetical protein SVIOM74S_09643 [Streptomyces violarus]